MSFFVSFVVVVVRDRKTYYLETSSLLYKVFFLFTAWNILHWKKTMCNVILYYNSFKRSCSRQLLWRKQSKMFQLKKFQSFFFLLRPSIFRRLVFFLLPIPFSQNMHSSLFKIPTESKNFQNTQNKKYQYEKKKFRFW